MATAAVYRYLHNQNRPYSANDIVLNLHKEYGKTAVQKSLDELCEQGRVLEKTYGKQTVYCVTQEATAESSAEQDMRALDRQITELREELSAVEERSKNSEFALKNLQASLTTEDATREEERLREEVQKLRDKLKTLKGDSAPVSAEDKAKVEKNHGKYLKEYRKRKRICVDIVDSILENCTKKKKDLMEEVGIETDEDVGCVLPK